MASSLSNQDMIQIKIDILLQKDIIEQNSMNSMYNFLKIQVLGSNSLGGSHMGRRIN